MHFAVILERIGKFDTTLIVDVIARKVYLLKASHCLLF